MFFLNIFKMQIKKVIYSKDFLFSLIIGLIVALACFVLEVGKTKGAHVDYLYAASDMWSPYSGTLEWYLPFIAFFLPLLACNACSTLISDNATASRTQILITRSGYINYYLATAFVVLIFSFIVTFVPLVINQLLWLTSSPINSLSQLRGDVYAIQEETQFMIYPYIHYNYPYLYNIIYMILLSLFGTVAALVSFSLSFVLKNKILIILIPTGLILLELAFTHISTLLYYAFCYILDPRAAFQYLDINFLFIVLIISTIIASGIIVIKTRRKDIYD